MVVRLQLAPPDFARLFGAVADHTRRDILRRAIERHAQAPDLQVR